MAKKDLIVPFFFNSRTKIGLVIYYYLKLGD